MPLLPARPGGYVIIGMLPQITEIQVGRLGLFNLERGWYLYCGSAHGSGGLHSRVTRHVRSEKKLFWHFDYLRPYLELTHILYSDSRISECDLCGMISTLEYVSFPVKKFGASDCRRGCISHLIYSMETDAPERVTSSLHEKISDLKSIDFRLNLIESSSSSMGVDN